MSFSTDIVVVTKTYVMKDAWSHLDTAGKKEIEEISNISKKQIP